jgi:phage shock protein PspC (stress-responsive transcriptional regulator)
MTPLKKNLILITSGILLIVVPPFFTAELSNLLPILFLAIALICFGFGGIFTSWRSRGAATLAAGDKKSVLKREIGTDTGKSHELATEEETATSSRETPTPQQRTTWQSSSYTQTLTQATHERATAPTASLQTSRTSERASSSDGSVTLASSTAESNLPQRATALASQTAGEEKDKIAPKANPVEVTANPTTVDEAGLFDIDPQLLHLSILQRVQEGLLELFDIDPAIVKAALAAFLQHNLDDLFDTEPEAVKKNLAEMLEARLLELFDIDPEEVKKVLTLRSDLQLAELFDTDPAEVKAVIATFFEDTLFDVEPDEVRRILAALSEAELLDLFDTDPEVVKTALKVQFAGEVLELFDSDPSLLRATFAWRQADALTELFDIDPALVRAMWEAQKAEPKSFEEAVIQHLSRVEAIEEHVDIDIPTLIEQHTDIVESFSQVSVNALERRRLASSFSEEIDTSHRVSRNFLRRRVAMRIVEDRIVALGIQQLAVSGIIAERRLSSLLKAALLGEISERITLARTLVKTLQEEAKQEMVRERLREQEAAFRATKRPGTVTDRAALERMRSRMLQKQ